MKKLISCFLILGTCLVASAQMYNTTTGASVKHAFPIGAYGTNYAVFPSYNDSTYKSDDTIKPVIWAKTSYVNIDTVKLHKNIVELPTPYAAVNGTATPLSDYQIWFSAHSFDSSRPVYIMQPNGTVSDTVTVNSSAVRALFNYKVSTGKWDKFPH